MRLSPTPVHLSWPISQQVSALRHLLHICVFFACIIKFAQPGCACSAEHADGGTFSQIAAAAANDASTAGAAASAGADMVYADTLPAQQPHAKLVTIDSAQVYGQQC